MASLVDLTLDYNALKLKSSQLSKPKLIKACKWKKVSSTGNKREIIQKEQGEKRRKSTRRIN